MTKEEAFYQSKINTLGISIYPVFVKGGVSLEIANHFENDITKAIIGTPKLGSIVYPNEADILAEKIRDLYERLYKEYSSNE